MFNTASSEDLWEEQALLNLVGNTHLLYQHSTATASSFDITTRSEDLGKEQALLNFVSNTHLVYQHSTAHHQVSILLALRTLGKSKLY